MKLFVESRNISTSVKFIMSTATMSDSTNHEFFIFILQAARLAVIFFGNADTSWIVNERADSRERDRLDRRRRCGYFICILFFFFLLFSAQSLSVLRMLVVVAFKRAIFCSFYFRSSSSLVARECIFFWHVSCDVL